MRSTKFNSRFPSALVASFLLVMAVDAKAYIDPGSSSYFFQLLIAGLMAVVYFFSSIKRRILGFFRKEDLSATPDAEKETQQTVKKDDSLTSR